MPGVDDQPQLLVAEAFKERAALVDPSTAAWAFWLLLPSSDRSFVMRWKITVIIPRVVSRIVVTTRYCARATILSISGPQNCISFFEECWRPPRQGLAEAPEAISCRDVFLHALVEGYMLVHTYHTYRRTYIQIDRQTDR